MFSIQKCICFLALIGLAACTPAAVESPTATPAANTPTPAVPWPTPAQGTPTPASGLFIRYHRSGGIAGVDETWLFYADGRVEYSGRGQGHAVRLSANQINALMAAARSPEVAALNESYVPANSCCDRFLYEITLVVDGQTKTVRTLDAAPDQPPALTNLLDAIDMALK
jgi:hypothetical protein